MRALVLAAGEGRRLRPLTFDRPKPMLPVGETPLLEQTVLLLRSHGIAQIAVNLHHRPQTILDHFGTGSRYGIEIHYSYEEQLLGSAGAVRKLSPFFCDSPFVVFYGDLYTDLDITRLLSVHRQDRALMTMALYEVNNPTACGIVQLDDQGFIERFVEKPQPDQVFSRLANAGVFVVDPEIIDLIPRDGPSDFGRDLIPTMLAAGLPIRGYRISDLLIDIGTPQNYRRAQQLASEHNRGVAYMSTLMG